MGSAYVEFMPIFAFIDISFCVMSYGGDVDEESAGHIGPTSINDVQLVALASIDVVWVDLKYVFSAIWYAWCLVMVGCHVVE